MDFALSAEQLDLRARAARFADALIPHEEAAEAADCKLGTVKSRINRGRAGLRAIIAHGEALPEG